MKISVVTIVFNDYENISKTIESVLSQKLSTDFEYIIIDGASNDGTLEVISNYKDKIKLISEPDLGIYDAINKGIKLAFGELLIFMNSSDAFYSQDSLQFLYDNYDPSQGFSLARTIYHHPTGKVKKDSPYLRNVNLPEFCHQSLLYNKKFHSQFGLYSNKLKSAADYDFFHKIYNVKNKNIKLDEVTSIRSKNGDDSSESILNTIEMIRIDFYNSCLIHSFYFRLKDIIAKLIKRSLKVFK